MNKIGYKAILDEMTRRVPPNKHIQFNSRVQHIRWKHPGAINDTEVEIEIEGGHMVRADHVIVTCSLGHLKHYAQRIFIPPLPKRKMDTIRALGFDAVDKLILIFDKPYWPNGTENAHLIRVNDPDLESCSTSPPLVRFFDFSETMKKIKTF